MAALIAAEVLGTAGSTIARYIWSNSLRRAGSRNAPVSARPSRSPASLAPGPERVPLTFPTRPLAVAARATCAASTGRPRSRVAGGVSRGCVGAAGWEAVLGRAGSVWGALWLFAGLLGTLDRGGLAAGIVNAVRGIAGLGSVKMRARCPMVALQKNPKRGR